MPLPLPHLFQFSNNSWYDHCSFVPFLRAFFRLSTSTNEMRQSKAEKELKEIEEKKGERNVSYTQHRVQKW